MSYIKNMKRTYSPERVVGYVRASTEEQHLGPDAQRRALQSWCERHGATLIAVFSDLGVSGAAPLEKRLGLLTALDALKREQAGVLLVAKRDRIARDVIISAMVERLAERNGAAITSADGNGNGATPEAQLMRNMIAAFADYERQLIRARTRAALGVKKARGERVGQIPFGSKLAADGVRLEMCFEEQAVIDDITWERRHGKTLKQITELLNTRGVRARGSRWHITSVRHILLRVAEEERLAAGGDSTAA
jgi:DNA invertase Pin-like site-specific DNA recombinase